MTSPTAIVLAAGEGTRLRPLTRHRPKPMLPAATRPILERVLDQLIEAGVRDITIVVGYGRDRVQSHFGPSYRNVPLTYVNQRSQLGTGHALLAAESEIDGPCLVLYGDQLVDGASIEAVVNRHDRRADATIGVLPRGNVERYGGVILEDDTVVEIVENPRDDREYYLNAGVYVLEPRIFDAIREAEPTEGEHSLVDAISTMVEGDDVVRGVVANGLWVDATYPWDLLDVSFELFEEGIVDGTHSVSEAPSATVHESATVREPVVIDHDCEIAPGAVIGPFVCLGANTTVGSNAVVTGSVVDTDTRIGCNATVVDCVTGVGVTIGSGTTIPGGPGDVRIGDRVFEGENLGGLLADRVLDRGGVMYVPGAIVGPESVIETGSVVRGTLPEETEVRS